MFFSSSLLLISKGIEVFLDFSFLSTSSFDFSFILYFDWKTFLFMSFVLLISSLIMNYSEEYMSAEKDFRRFIYLMVLFVFSMMVVISSLNLISILLGWDGLGLVSYALVIFYQNEKSFNAGMLTALSNRVGDAALLMSISLMVWGSWSFMGFMDFDSMNFKVISLFIILASITKSAQIPFSSWLPAAMAAPTPVSSLVHSSTLVTAGVYLMIRFFDSFSSAMMGVLLFSSLFTMFMAGVCANLEYDLKKIIALSTLSQLGMMISILSLGDKELAFFHLLTHALFKALLFMCAGAIIHNLGDFQDIRYMGSLIYYMPLSLACMNLSNLALCGLPFLSGFYSKDLIMEVLSMKFSSSFVYMVFFLSVGLTVSYSFRLSFYIFFSPFYGLSCKSVSDSSNYEMTKSMLGLVFFVVIMGSCLSWFIFPSFYFIILPLLLKLMTLLFIVLGAILGFEIINFGMFLSRPFSNFSAAWFLTLMWNFPTLSTMGVSSKFLGGGSVFLKKFDQGWLEEYGVGGISRLIKLCSSSLQAFSLNYLGLYFFMVMVFMVFLFSFVI
uniref:NADH-ubiquinone oxidoreductase chain 5 n=1 Tax=Phloeosinus perlatus TaxID=2800998 RepID=A0A891GPX1_9CUCU|nr:NADH dehydrogenase subunit 5 [Phloeosinus perlatus]QRK25829.1 NADH dehydrogenase subunit 5 [Phloeosinus perlatus]